MLRHKATVLSRLTPALALASSRWQLWIDDTSCFTHIHLYKRANEDLELALQATRPKDTQLPFTARERVGGKLRADESAK